MSTSRISARNIYIVGCGGVASWLLPLLIKLLVKVEEPPTIHLIDGDKLEKRNLDRQLFDESQIGQFKAEALANIYRKQYPRMAFRNEFLAEGAENIEHGSIFFCCADNHAARKRVLSMADEYNGRAIIGGNEYTDADAYFYEPAYLGTNLDPRVYFPEINTSTAGDPTRPASCQGEAAVATPQLVLANSSAANMMLWLFYFHYFSRPDMELDSRPYWPVRHHNTFTRFGTELVRDKDKATK